MKAKKIAVLITSILENVSIMASGAEVGPLALKNFKKNIYSQSKPPQQPNRLFSSFELR
jgi:hypothetical protein